MYSMPMNDTEMESMWILRFIRRDGKPDEEYYYHTRREAENHKELFRDDDSGLYEDIEIVQYPN